MIPISSYVKEYMGKPAIYINDVPCAPQIYALTDSPTSNRSWERLPSMSIRNFSENGFRLFQLDVWFEDMLSPDGTLDITFAKNQIRGIADVCPDGAVMFRLHGNPPFFWLKENPDEWVRYADTETVPAPDFIANYERYLEHDLKNHARPSYASEKWLSFMGDAVARFCKELSECPEGDRVFAIQIANGVYGENHYWGFVSHDPDISNPMQNYFRNYAQNLYKTEENLKKAYSDDSISFNDISVPRSERYNLDDGIFRDPKKSRRIYDYFHAQHKAVADSIRYFCRIIHENWCRPIIVGAFYGYYLSIFGRHATGGHLLEQEILNAPEIDFLSAPQAYSRQSREPGGPGLSRGLIESVTLHKKVWLDEMDQPTHHGSATLGGMHTFGPEQSVYNNRKCVLEPFVRGGGLWYYDFGKYNCAGWWDDPIYKKDVKKLKDLFDRQFKKQYTSPSDVLLVFDTDVFFHTALSEKIDPITDMLSVNAMTINTFKSGVSASTVYLSDLPYVDFSKYKVVVFANCFSLTDEQTEFIHSHVAKDGRNLFWCSFPGYVRNRECLDDTNVSNVAQMKLSPMKFPMMPKITYNDDFGGISMGDIVASGKASSVEQCFFAVDDEDSVPLAKYENGKTAAAKKKHSSHTDYFFALPPVSAELQRFLYSECECHIYDTNGDSVLAGSGLIVISTKDGGERVITLRDGRKINISMIPSQTVILDEITGEILLY